MAKDDAPVLRGGFGPRQEGEALLVCLQRKEGLEAVLDSITRDGLITVDETGQVAVFNRAAEQLTGLTRTEASGLTAEELFTRILGSGSLIKQALAEGRYGPDEEQEVLSRDGSRRRVAVTASPILEDTGQRAGIMVVLRDIQDLHELREQLIDRFRFHHLIGKSRPMQAVYQLIRQVAGSGVSVLIEGESGTGKELVAHAIHVESARARGPFVPVNCAALPEGLLESELFGHVRGAFTGAHQDRTGRFDAANGGTIFLDEIGEMSPLIQVKLLRVLQGHEFERVGESKPRRVDVRVLAATNRNLWELVQAGKFRDDLYYRLNVVTIHLPPLRERRDDIPLLLDHFIGKFSRELGKEVRSVSRHALRALMGYDWPGNVRELANVIERAVLLTAGRSIDIEDLALGRDRGRPRAGGPAAGPMMPTESGAGGRPAPETGLALKDLEQAHIAWVLAHTEGRRNQAAALLGISLRSLYRKLREYGLSGGPAGAGPGEAA
ncbi:MAG: sigma 54-interacting transcriptional regulator [Deltaproteobacteria bacterium]|nr:sigma 54-interacting transcriptional regulator [Deltaproteobacteria bacterium]